MRNTGINFSCIYGNLWYNLNTAYIFYVSIQESCPSGLRCGSRKAVCLQSTVGSNPMLSVYCAVIVQYYPNKTSYLQFKKGVLYRQDSFFAVILSGTCSYCQTVDLCRHISCTVAVVYIYYCYAVGTGIDHCQQR